MSGRAALLLTLAHSALPVLVGERELVGAVLPTRTSNVVSSSVEQALSEVYTGSVSGVRGQSVGCGVSEVRGQK